jgi:hypothetical protein
MGPKSGSKGYALEELLRLYFLQSGYFVLRGLPYTIDGEDITDVDLWLYERPAATTRRRSIVDIKNKKTPKSAERVVWTKGLQEALSVDTAFVATTDKRAPVKRLAKKLGVILLDGEVTGKLSSSGKIKDDDRISGEDFDLLVKDVDQSRRSKEWRNHLDDTQRSLLTSFGFQSANQSLNTCAYFGEQALTGQPNSKLVTTAARLFYLSAAIVAISLDFVVADAAFRSPEERQQLLIEGLRFGQSDDVSSLNTVKMAIALAKQYAESGAGVAKQIESKFLSDANRIPAEIIAEFVAKVSARDQLFNSARELEKAAFATRSPTFDSLSTETKAFLGSVLDFHGQSRERFAAAWQSKGPTASVSPPSEPKDGMDRLGPLFIKR